jgi:hypothetical protein
MNTPLIIFLLVIFSTAKAESKGHRGHPTPTPTPTPTPLPPPPQVTLAWTQDAVTGDPNTDAAGYYLKLGFAPGAETQVIDVGNVGIWTLQLTSGATYFFIVTAYNAARQESPPSNEISYSAP